MTTNTSVSWGLEPPPRNLETAPAAVKARLRYSQTVFVTVSIIGVAVGGCLLANVPLELGWAKVAVMAVCIGVFALSPFLIGRSFNQTTRACLRDAAGLRLVVVSVEKVSQVRWGGGGLLVTLKGVDQPALETGVVIDRVPAGVALEGKEVVGLPTVRGEHLALGILEGQVVVAEPLSRLLQTYSRDQKSP